MRVLSGGRGYYYMKWLEMFIVLYRGVNYRFCILFGVFRIKLGVLLKVRYLDKLIGFEVDFISLV